MEIRKKLITANRIRQEKGWSAVKNKIKFRLRERREEIKYRKWLAKHRIDAKKREKIKSEIAAFAENPLISVIVPVYDIEEKWLRKCIESVLKQIYENWELCLSDDKSPRPHVKKVLEEYARKDARIKICLREANGHISAASNSALSLAAGEFCVLLDHDDELTEDALFQIAKVLGEFPETAFIYSDEDVIDEKDRCYAPKFKPDFSRDLFYSLNLITHLSAYRTKILREIGGFRVGLEGSQDYDLALRFIERIDEKQIRHIPKILYHWRAIRGSVAFSSDEKPYAHERARQALRDHFERTGKKAAIEHGIYHLHRIRYELPENLPKVSLILQANDDFGAAQRIIAEFREETAYDNLEIIAICPKSAENQSFDADLKVVFNENSPNAASFNQAVFESTGEILCFVDRNLLPLSKDWLKELVSFTVQKEIGAVGGKILDKDEKIIGGGLIIGGETLDVAHRNLPRDADGNLYRARVINNFSAVSMQCMAVRREVFDENGFDAENLPDALFGADFCLKLGEKGLRNVFTPYAELIEVGKTAFESPPSASELEFFRRRWRKTLERDPFYNPNLSLRGETFTIRI